MQLITINSIFKVDAAPYPFQFPIIDRTELDHRIQVFLQERKHQSEDRQSIFACRNLFQEKSSELFFFPRLNTLLPDSVISSGNLAVCYIEDCGLIVCFFPKLGTQVVTDKSSKSLSFPERDFYPPESNSSSRFRFHHACISCLLFEDAWIDRTSGSPVLRGLELILLKKFSRAQALFCKRLNQVSSPEMPCRALMRHKKYIKVSCEGKYDGFSCSIKIPVLSKAEIEEKIKIARCQRARILNIQENDSSHATLEVKLFPEQNVNHHLIDFPHAMGIDFPFGQTGGGEIFFSYSEDDLRPFRVVFISDFFREGQTKENIRHLDTFLYKKIGSPNLSNSRACTSNPFSCSGEAKIIYQSVDNECYLEGIKLRLLSNASQSSFVLCLSRQKEATSVPNLTDSLSSDPGEGGSGLGRRSPLPGPSGVMGHRSISRSRKRGEGRSGPSSGKSRYQPYPSSSLSQPTAMVSVPPERQGKQQIHMSSQKPLLMGASHAFPPLASSERLPISPSESGLDRAISTSGASPPRLEDHVSGSENPALQENIISDEDALENFIETYPEEHMIEAYFQEDFCDFNQLPDE